MKLNVFQYTVDGLSTYDESYMKRLAERVREAKNTDRFRWIQDNKIKLTLDRYKVENELQYEHRYCIDVTDAQLLDYLLRFTKDPIEL